MTGIRLVRPLRALTRAARDRDEHLPSVPVARHDEIGRLTAAFNELSAHRSRTEQQRKVMVMVMVNDIAHELRTPLRTIRSTSKGRFRISPKPALNCDFAKSGRQDLNLRPLDPQSSALPSCATSRCPSDLGFPLSERARKQYRTRAGGRAPVYRGQEPPLRRLT